MVEQRTAIGGNLDFDWSAPNAMDDGYIQRMLKLQDTHRVFWSDHQQAWIVSRHEDILEALNDTRLSNSRFHLPLESYAKANGIDAQGLVESVRGWVFNMDGDNHQRLRGLMLKPFSKARIRQYENGLERIFSSILDDVEERDSIEFVSEIAFSFVSKALLHIVGLEGAVSHEQVIRWGRAIEQGIVPPWRGEESLRDANAVIDEVTAIITAEIDKRRLEPRDDLLTDFVHSADDGGKLGIDDVVMIFQVLLLAAIDTTANTLTLMVRVLSQSASHRDYIRNHPEKMTEIIEELQRYVCMQNMVHKIAAQDFVWHGQQIRKGDLVFLMLGIGNWDKSVYERPDVLDFERERKMPLMFSPGLHHCIGHNVAKLELEVGVRLLVERYSNVLLAEEQLNFKPNFMMRALERLDVRFVRNNG